MSAQQPVLAAPMLGDLDLHLIAEGRHGHLADCLGAQLAAQEGVAGVRFAVWAPNARRVSVVGDFNAWDGRRNKMRFRPGVGVWELFIPGVEVGALYKYELHDARGRLLPLKADPLARQSEMPPGTASIVPSPEPFIWSDADWMATRAARQASGTPLSIYEVHMGSWMHPTEEGPVWETVGRRLIHYAVDMGYTHIELLPISEHPFGGSWGYQPLGLFAPTARWGTPTQFARFVDECHAAGLGVLVDWVPAHFPNDAHGLVRFDGTALYEHADPRQGFHPDWNTLIYNFGRNEVRNFLQASALEWLRRYHVDGLRVDAVASMLYLDYSRKEGEWVPNRHGGRENLEAISFLQELNATVREQGEGALMIAEESTAWPGVTAPVDQGGLGFHYKWNMGWMHDTLHYMEQDPIHRKYHHEDMSFGLVYAWSERFILPLSHDEVVHGKRSLLGKMPGDAWQRHANLRAYLAFMFGHPGKKLLFMGAEIGQETEWNHDSGLDWPRLADPLSSGVQKSVRDLNALYRECRPLYALDHDPAGFRWLIGDDRDNSVFAFLRMDGRAMVLVICNMTPVVRRNYRVGVPRPGLWRERMNTDAVPYGGSGVGNAGQAWTEGIAAHGEGQSLRLVLPPLATLMLRHEEEHGQEAD